MADRMSTAESPTPRPSAPPGRMTYEQFLDWADEDTLAEWVDGEVVMTSPANARHQLVAGFLYRVIARFVELHRLGLVLPPPFQMHLPNAPSGRAPDVLFIANEHLGRLQPPVQPTHVEGPADLVVEVVSPESVDRDNQETLREYRVGGVPEYWIVDPRAREARFYRLDARGAYRQVAPDARGVYRARVLPGLWLRVDWLWQDTLPEVEAAVQQIDEAVYLDDLVSRLDTASTRRLIDHLRQQGKMPYGADESSTAQERADDAPGGRAEDDGDGA
jgi:Uma2 family endonuclease